MVYMLLTAFSKPDTQSYETWDKMYNNIQCCHWEIGNKEGDFIVEISNFSKTNINFLPGDTKSGWIHGSCQKRQYLGALDLYQIIMCFWQGNIQLTRVSAGKRQKKNTGTVGEQHHDLWPHSIVKGTWCCSIMPSISFLNKLSIRLASLRKINHQIVTISTWKLCRHYGTVCTIMYMLWRH